MTTVQFRKLATDDQLITVITHGILLLEFKRYNLVIQLFSLQGFYVEVISNCTTSEVLVITTFIDVDELDHILETIDLSELGF